MIFQYVAYNETEELVKGKLSASNEEAASEMLGYAGYRAVSLKPHVPFFSLDKLVGGLSEVNPTEIILLYRQLALLLESGTDIAGSFELLKEQVDNRALRRVLVEVIADIRAGSQLSAALAKHPKIFAPMYSRLLGIGEHSGDLESILRQVADYMEQEATAGKQTKNALMYPVITFLVTAIVIAILISFVLPSFGTLYSSLGVELPSTMKLLMSITEMARSNGMYITLGLLVVVGAAFIYMKTPKGRYARDKVVLKLPRVGRVKHLSELARCCRSMSLLFHSGLPLTEIMPLVTQGADNVVIAQALNDVQRDMVKGEGLSLPMTKHRLFLPMMVQMVRVGEETGNLDVTLLAVAKSYETEAEDKLRTLIALIQPAMTLFIGVIIGLLALSLTSAMYSMYGGL
jgi:type IV pilus assembly protein PilC